MTNIDLVEEFPPVLRVRYRKSWAQAAPAPRALPLIGINDVYLQWPYRFERIEKGSTYGFIVADKRHALLRIKFIPGFSR